MKCKRLTGGRLSNFEFDGIQPIENGKAHAANVREARRDWAGNAVVHEKAKVACPALCPRGQACACAELQLLTVANVCVVRRR